MLSHSGAGAEPLALCMTQEPPQTLSKHCCQGANRLSTFSRAEAATFHGWLAQTTSSTLMPLEFTGGVSVPVWRRHHVIKASFTFMLGWFPHYQVGYIQNIKTASKPAGFYGCVEVPAGFPDVRWPCAVSRQWSPIPSVTLFTGHLPKSLEGNKET